MADDRDKLDGQRAAVEEHIAKYEMYEGDEHKEFALKTIRRIQAEIRDILRAHPYWESSWQEDWEVA